MKEHADVLYDFLSDTAREEDDGRLISREPLYPVLMQHFHLTDPEARRARTAAVRELTEAGKIKRVAVRSRAVEVYR
jgi:hypothetical protein